MRLLYTCLIAALLAAPASGATASGPTAAVLLADIPPQSLTAALNDFSNQTGLQHVFFSEVAEERRSKGARAGVSVTDALSQLLNGTGLKFEFLNPRLVRIYAAEPEPVTVVRNPDTPASLEQPVLPPIVVRSAPYGLEPLDHQPIDAVVWTQQAMEASGVKGMEQIAALTPDVEFDFLSTVGSGVYTNMAIRGVTDRHGSATGIYIGDVPVPPIRSNNFGRALPSAFDLNSIEVLRGPQGTLLGANTQGGAVRFVPNQPSLTTLDGLAHAEWATTARGDPSYETGAAVGAPLIPGVLGLRVSGWYRSSGGYVDRVDPFTGATVDENSNLATNKSARAALTFAPNAFVSISPALSYESAAARDSPSFFTYLSNPSAGQLKNGSLVAQPFDDTYYLVSLGVQADWVRAKLNTSTAYFHRMGDTVVDNTESVFWGGWGDPRGPAYPTSYDDAVTTDLSLQQEVLSQEVRLTSPDPSGPLTWITGAFYSNARSREGDIALGAHIPAYGNLPLDVRNTTTTRQTQAAVFAELDLRIARFTFSPGLRIEREAYDASAVTPIFRSQDAETLAIPKFVLSYETDEHDLYYFSAAKGYAPAGADPALATCLENPTPYPTDIVWSYELGAKQRLWDGRAHLDGSVFHIHWNNGPVATGNCLFTHLPGTAASNGFDLAARVLIWESMTAAISMSYTEAHYTETVTQDGVPIVHDGDAVGTPPLVTSPWNVVASLERRVSLLGGAATFRVEDIFHSRNPGPFYTSSPATSPYYSPGLTSDPSTNMLNLRTALDRANVSMAIFVNNVLDSQPTLLKRNKGLDASTLFYATTFRPRTVGLSGTWRF